MKISISSLAWDKNEEKDVGLTEFAKDYTRKLAPVIMPLIRDISTSA